MFLIELLIIALGLYVALPDRPVSQEPGSPAFLVTGPAESDPRLESLARRCRSVMATPTTLLPSWLVATTCYAVHHGDAMYCASEDWPCVVAAALSGLDGSSDPCLALAPGVSRRACELVVGDVEISGRCPLAVDVTLCDGALAWEVEDSMAALLRFRRAWFARKALKRKTLRAVCEAPYKTFRDYAAQCACAEWERNTRPGASIFEGCPRCVKMRPRMEEPVCPFEVLVRGPPEKRIAANPTAFELSCWTVGTARQHVVELHPGVSRTVDTTVTGLRCFPPGP